MVLRNTKALSFYFFIRQTIERIFYPVLKTKVSMIICIYTTPHGNINLNLVDALDRFKIKSTMDFWGTNYHLDELVKAHVRGGYRVRYKIVSRRVWFPVYLQIGYSENYFTIKKTLDYLNDIHDRMLMLLSDDEIEANYRKYGNYYISQIKGEKV